MAEHHDVVLYLGGKLNDFAREYYVKDVVERRTLAEQDAAEFGRKFIPFPNPTDGHWLAAVFGSSEPEDAPQYRERMHAAATTGR